MPRIFPGQRLFDLKATHGLPLEVAIDRILASGFSVDWIGFIEQARRCRWWDFQTIEAIDNALVDSEVALESRLIILSTLRRWVVSNPHPNLVSKILCPEGETAVFPMFRKSLQNPKWGHNLVKLEPFLKAIDLWSGPTAPAPWVDSWLVKNYRVFYYAVSAKLQEVELVHGAGSDTFELELEYRTQLTCHTDFFEYWGISLRFQKGVGVLDAVTCVEAKTISSLREGSVDYTHLDVSGLSLDQLLKKCFSSGTWYICH